MAGVFDRIAGVSEILKFLLSVKPDDVKRVSEALRVVVDGDAELKDRVLAGLEVADVFTDYTPGEFDDQVVDMLQDVGEEAAFWSLVEAIEEMLGGKKSSELSIHAKGPAIKTGKGDKANAIPVSVIVQIAIFILQLFHNAKDSK